MQDQVFRCCASGLVWRICDELAVDGVDHVRIRRIDDPTELRTIARSVIEDRGRFMRIADAAIGAAAGEAPRLGQSRRAIAWNFQRVGRKIPRRGR